MITRNCVLKQEQVTDRVRNARFATFTGFVIMGALLYLWSTGVTSFRAQNNMSEETNDVSFGLITLGLGSGAAIGCFLIGRLIDRWGGRKVVGTALILYPLSIIPLGYTNGFESALFFATCYGFLRGTVDTALNTHGVQVERFYGRSIMSSFHAFFSVGGFASGLLGSWLVGLYPNSPAIAFTVIGSVLFIMAVVSSRYLLDKNDVPAASIEENYLYRASTSTCLKDSKPSKYLISIMIGFGLILLASMVSEGAVVDWGQVFIHRELDASPQIAGLAVSIFIGVECIGRFFGDWLAEKIGAVRVVFLSGVSSVIGLMLLSLGNSAIYGILGMALVGLGLACVAPLMLSSAGRRDPTNSGRNIGIVNCIGYTGMLIGPMSITTIVATFGLSSLMFFPAALMTLLTIFGPIVMIDKKFIKKIKLLKLSQYDFHVLFRFMISGAAPLHFL